MKCDGCGYDMTGEDGNTTIGISFNYIGDTRQEIRFREMFGKGIVNICYCCWAKSMGAKPINDQAK